jgi:hypothetical protein
MLFRHAPSVIDTALITAASHTPSKAPHRHLPAHTHSTMLPKHPRNSPHPHSLTSLTPHTSAFLRLIALLSYHPNPTHESSAPGRGVMEGGAGQLFSGGDRGCGAGVVTAEPSWVAKRPQTLRPGRGLAAQRVVAVARMSGRRPRRSSPCPRPLSAVRMSVQSVKRTSGVHASGVHATGAIQVSRRTGLPCPRLCSRAVRTALDPGMARCSGPSPLAAMGSTCRRGPRAAWSPARIGPDGKG